MWADALLRVVALHGGIATRDQFRRHGITGRMLTAAVRSGILVRLRRAWYALPSVDAERRLAIMLGGRLGGISAARSYGWWDGDDKRTHVSWPAHGNVAKPGRPVFDAERLNRSARHEIVSHWRSLREAPEFEAELWRESPEQTLAQVLLSADRLTAIACADSAIHCGTLSWSQVAAVFAAMPARIRGWQRYVDGRPDSGLESIVRVWLLDRGIPFRLHPHIRGVGEVDFVIGRSLIVEVDGREFHEPQFNRDLRRDNDAARIGCITARLGYPLIMHDWHGCEQRLLTHLARGDHQRPLR